MTELAVLVPVLNRPQNVGPLVESFLAGCPEDSILCFIYSMSDEAERDAIAQAGAPRVASIGQIGGGTSWPHRVNFGVRHWDADWYLCAADDIRFTKGWWDATAEARTRVGFIGTNDSIDGTGNPRVAAGIHTCHPLVSREYTALGGADGGPFCYEGVKHWYIDDILIRTAQMRGQWEYVSGAVVQHLHPYWQLGEWDSTYAKGEENAETDRLAFIDFATKYLGLKAL